MRSPSTAWPWWPGAAVAGLALIVPASIDTARLSSGGLAPVAFAALIAAVVSIPTARLLWQQAARDAAPHARSLWHLAPLLGLFWVAAVAAQQTPDEPLSRLGLCIGAIAVFLTVRVRPALAPVIWTAVATVSATALALFSISQDTPYTLLEPHWETWSEWMPWSLSAGLLLAMVGLGTWSRGSAMPPGGSRMVWIPAALGLWVMVAMSVRLGVQYDQYLGPAHDPLRIGVAMLCAAAGLSVLLAHRDDATQPAPLALMVVLWFAGPGFGGLDWTLQGWLPLGLTLILADATRTHRGLERAVLALAAITAGASAFWGWPEAPENPVDAVRAALSGLALLWIAGTRGLREDVS